MWVTFESEGVTPFHTPVSSGHLPTTNDCFKFHLLNAAATEKDRISRKFKFQSKPQSIPKKSTSFLLCNSVIIQLSATGVS